MCGIGGIQFTSSLKNNQDKVIEKFEHSLSTEQSYRGPDNFGKYFNPGLSTHLFHNRLSILDLSVAANQPFLSEDNNIALVFNGEIFNWRELRDELVCKGFSFRTSSDTEVLLNLYLSEGVGLLARVQGMFAFAIIDVNNDHLFLARDSIGKKPLFYSQSEIGFAFASSITPLKSYLGNQAVISNSSILTFLLPNFRHVPEPFSGFDQIKKLRPGHAMIVRNGEIINEWRFFNPSFSKHSASEGDLDDLFASSVKRRVDADVPVSALLSGGLDSSLVVALMKKNITEDINTFVLGMDCNDLDVQRSRYVSKLLKTRHHEYFFDSEHFFDCFKKIIQTYNEPVCLLPLVYTYILCSKIKENGIKVALTGHGADELFAGYLGYRRQGVLSRALKIPVADFLLKNFLPQLIVGSNSNDFSVPGIRKWKIKNEFGTHRFFYKRSVFNYLVDEYEIWESSLQGGATFLDESLFYSLLYENQHSLQFSADFPAMLASIEIRSPFLDERIIDYAFRSNDTEKVGYWGRVSDLKLCIRKLSSRYLDREIINFEKRGFGNGISEESLLRGPWKKHVDRYFKDLVDPSNTLDLDEVRRSWIDFQVGRRRPYDAQDLLKIVALQIWFRNL